jgi:hypothetical protein
MAKRMELGISPSTAPSAHIINLSDNGSMRPMSIASEAPAPQPPAEVAEASWQARWPDFSATQG